MKWIRLKGIVDSISGGDVTITVSTFPFQEDMKAFVTLNGGNKETKNYDIVLNASFAKDDEDILKIVCHELSHILTGTPEHDEKFDEAYQKTLSKVLKKYKEEPNAK